TSPSSSGQKLALNAPVSANLFRFTGTGERLTYVGKKGRIFQVSAQLSFDVAASLSSADYTFYFVKIPAGTSTPDPQLSTEAYADTSGGLQAVGLQGNVYLNSGDAVELWVRRTSGSNNITLKSFTVTIE